MCGHWEELLEAGSPSTVKFLEMIALGLEINNTELSQSWLKELTVNIKI